MRYFSRISQRLESRKGLEGEMVVIFLYCDVKGLLDSRDSVEKKVLYKRIVAVPVVAGGGG